MKKIIFFALLGIAIGISTLAQASLIDRGNGMYYDTDYNITWLDQSSSSMKYEQAKTWVAGLSVGGFTDWRLPSSLNKDGSGLVWGYNATGSEMGHLFYTVLTDKDHTELRNKGFVAPDGSYPTPFGLTYMWPFQHLTAGIYWSGTPYNTSDTWTFNFATGGQYYNVNDYGNGYALAVRDGDVVTIPIPATVILLATGLAGLAGTMKK